MPYYHSQNLNEPGSKWLHGRAWFRPNRNDAWPKRELHWEWCFGKKANSCACSVTFGNGDDDRGVLFRIGIPWLFAIYVGISGIYRCRESEIGFAIHNNSLWIYTFSLCNEWNRDMPWWRRGFSWSFPWSYDWHSTEIMEHKAPCVANAIWREDRPIRLGKDSFAQLRSRQEAETANSETYSYRYTLKNGTVQIVEAKVHVTRMTWRMRWWPLLPFSKSRTSIGVNFSSEVGEGTGSWKGGCVGCGYDFEYPNETPLECLRRMERDRKFGR